MAASLSKNVLLQDIFFPTFDYQELFIGQITADMK